jgi:PEP-CTERM motif
MKRNVKLCTLVAALVLVGNAHAANIPETVAGNLMVSLGTNPHADDVYSVLHTSFGNFVDTYTFSVSNTSTAVSAYGTLELPSLYGMTVSSFNLYTSGGSLVSAGTITTSSPNSSAGLISTSGLANGAYYYELSGSVTGTEGGAYQFSQITAPVPEPSTYALMFMGLTAVGYAVMRQRHKLARQTGFPLAA